jgi:hypothetical protein
MRVVRQAEAWREMRDSIDFQGSDIAIAMPIFAPALAAGPLALRKNAHGDECGLSSVVRW